jgi:hypothetical protein
VPPRLAAPLAVAALAAVLVAGCGGSSPETTGSRSAPVGAAARSCGVREALRATGVSCAQARRVMYGWRQRGSCSSPPGASRVSCTTGSYRCLGAHTERGTAVSCSRPGRSIAFVVKH